MIAVTREMPAGRESLDCTISSGETQFLDQRSLSSKPGPAKEQTGGAGSSFCRKQANPKPRGGPPPAGWSRGSPYFLLFLPVARRKKTPSRGEAWEGVFFISNVILEAGRAYVLGLGWSLKHCCMSCSLMIGHSSKSGSLSSASSWIPSMR